MSPPAWNGLRIVEIVPGEARCKQPNHRHFDERFASLHFALVVYHQPTVAKQPGECSFDHPAFRLHSESMLTRSALDNFKIPVTHSLAPIGQVFAPVGRVSPDLLEPRDKIF